MAAFSPNTIPTVTLPQLFPGIEGSIPLEVSSAIFSFAPREMPLALPWEQLVLAAIVRSLKPAMLLEFGTAQGQTAYALAANSPVDAEVYTVDIEYASEYKTKCLRGDAEVGQWFRHSPYAGKIRQLYRSGGDVLPDPLPVLAGQFQFIHIDAEHGYGSVKADTLAALSLAAPGAVFTWHDFYDFPDYVRDGSERRGVYPWLNELAATRRLGLRRIVGTYLVVGSERWETDAAGSVLQPGDTLPPFGDHIVRLAETGWREE